MESDQNLLSPTVTESTFQLTVEQISQMTKAVSSSPVICQHLPWNIVVKPNFELNIGKQPLGFFITCEGNASNSSWTCPAAVEFSLLHYKKNRKPFTRKVSHIFCDRDNTVGIENFLLWEEVIDTDNGYAKDNSLTFEVCVMPELPGKKKTDFSVTEVVLRHTLRNILNINKSVQLGPFTACDFSWKITVKPPSKELLDKPNSLGLYLQCNREVFVDNWACNARVELRLLSHQSNNQNTLCRILQHQFSSKKNTSGVDDLVLWKDLLNEDTGYIKNDSITVEVQVIPDKFDLKAYLNIPEATFWYKFENISKINIARLSPPCFIANLPWQVKIIPNKEKEGLKHALFACYIYCNEGNKSKTWNCNAIGEIRLVSNKPGKKPLSRKLMPHHFDEKHNNWGFDCFMLWKDVINPDMGFVQNDSITVEAYVRVLAEPSETIEI